MNKLVKTIRIGALTIVTPLWILAIVEIIAQA